MKKMMQERSTKKEKIKRLAREELTSLELISLPLIAF